MTTSKPGAQVVAVEEKRDGKLFHSLRIVEPLSQPSLRPGKTEPEIEDSPLIGISSFFFYEPLNLLVINFCDREMRMFKIKGLSQTGLDIEQFPQSLKLPFLVENASFGIHSISQSLVFVLVGEQGFIAVYGDPSSENFLK